MGYHTSLQNKIPVSDFCYLCIMVLHFVVESTPNIFFHLTHYLPYCYVIIYSSFAFAKNSDFLSPTARNPTN